MAFAQCGDNAELTAWSGSDPDRSVAWFAVTDPDARLTWVVGPSGVFGPVQVLDRVWWQARSPDPSS